jgi:hypothetical protein
MYLLAALAALEILLRGLGGLQLRSLVTAAFCTLVFLAVLGQTAWMLRPFFGRPSQQEVPFVRAREGSFADAVLRSGHSITQRTDETCSGTRRVCLQKRWSSK